jgi:hypothetical protein
VTVHRPISPPAAFGRQLARIPASGVLIMSRLAAFLTAVIGFCVAGAVVIAALATAEEHEPPIELSSRRKLFVDRTLIDRLEGATLKLHEPVSGGTAIRIDKPWEGPGNFGMSVIELDGRLLMYYRGWSLVDPKDESGVACVAESRDGGATWTKPSLDLVKRPDWPANNIIATVDGEPRFSAKDEG